jgi:hypothetical protein
LSAIVEKRNPSGEETDDDDEDEDERVFPTRGPADKEVKDEAVIKSGFLWKKGERRKVSLVIRMITADLNLSILKLY